MHFLIKLESISVVSRIEITSSDWNQSFCIKTFSASFFLFFSSSRHSFIKYLRNLNSFLKFNSRVALLESKNISYLKRINSSGIPRLLAWLKTCFEIFVFSDFVWKPKVVFVVFLFFWFFYGFQLFGGREHLKKKRDLEGRLVDSGDYPENNVSNFNTNDYYSKNDILLPLKPIVINIKYT